MGAENMIQLEGHSQQNLVSGKKEITHRKLDLYHFIDVYLIDSCVMDVDHTSLNKASLHRVL